MSPSLLKLIFGLLAVLINNNHIGVNGQSGYESTCTCNSVSSGVCTQYTCTTTVQTSCFSGSSQVALDDGSSKALSDITSNDRALVNEHNTYEPVIAFIHAKLNGLFEFLAIDVQSLMSNATSTLFVTANHLVFDFDSGKACFAGDFRVGDRVQFVENSEIVPGEVVRIRLTKQKGFYAPLTPSGTIVIDGVRCSNYATVSNHDLAHNVMGIYRFWINLVGPPTLSNRIPWMLQIMLNAEKIMRWSSAQILADTHIYDGTFEVSAIG
jgi:hypothetical protein